VSKHGWTWADPSRHKLIMLGGIMDGEGTDRLSSYQAIYTISMPVIASL